MGRPRAAIVAGIAAAAQVAAQTPTATRTASPTPSPSPYSCIDPDLNQNGFMASFYGLTSYAYSSSWRSYSYFYDTLSCADAGNLSVSDGPKMVVITLDVNAADNLLPYILDPNSTLPGSGGTLVVDTCNANTMYDTRLWVGSGCAVAGNSYLLSCIASNDNAGEGPSWQCGDRSRVEIPLVAAVNSPISAFNRFTVVMSAAQDPTPGKYFTIRWSWTPPQPTPAETPDVSSTASASRTRTRNSSPSWTPSATGTITTPTPTPSKTPTKSVTPTLTRSVTLTSTRTINSSPTVTPTMTPSINFPSFSRTNTKTRTPSGSKSPSGSPSGSGTPSNTPTISTTPSNSPSPGFCDEPVGLAASYYGQASGSFTGVFGSQTAAMLAQTGTGYISYWYDSMDCAADDMASYDESTRMIIFSVDLGLSEFDDYSDPNSTEPGSGGTLVVDTCNRNTLYDTQLWVGTGCPVPGNPYLFGCIGSNDDGAESYEPPLWQCGDRARVEVPLVSAPRNAYSASNRFLIGVSPYFDVTPGVTRVQVSWNWVPPASQTPSPSASPSTTASASQSLSYLASPSGSPSNSPSNSASGSPTRSDTPSMSITPSASRTVSPTRTKTINSSVSKTPTVTPSSGNPSSSRTMSKSRSQTPSKSPSSSPSASQTPSNTPTISVTPTNTPSPGWCAEPDGLAGVVDQRSSGNFTGYFGVNTYWYDTMDCAADDGASFDEQAKMSMFAITLGSDIWDRLGDYESIEPYSGGSLIVDTCNRNTMYDTQLWVGTGCPMAGNPYLFGCIGSNDDGSENYDVDGWQCGDRSRVEIPLVSIENHPYSVWSRFLIAVSPYFDQAPGTQYRVQWRWIPPPSATPSASASPSESTTPTASLSTGASSSNSPSNSASTSGTPSGSSSDTPSMSYTPTASRTVTITRTRTINSSLSKTPTVTATVGAPSSSRTSSKTRSQTPSKTPSSSPSASQTPSNTPTISVTPTATPSQNSCLDPTGLAANYMLRTSGSYVGTFWSTSYWYDEMFCVADEMAAFDEQAKMVIFAVTIGTETYDQLYDTDSEEPGSGGYLIVSTCNRNTMYDTQLWVGNGCPVAGNPWMFGCIASNDDGGEDYTPVTGWQCGDRSRVEIPLTSSESAPNSMWSRFLIAVSPYFDQAPGTKFQVDWRWVPPNPPSASETPSPSESPSPSASLSFGATPSGSPSNSASTSSTPSGSSSDTSSMSYTPTGSRTVTITRTRTINSSMSKTPSLTATPNNPTPTKTMSKSMSQTPSKTPTGSPSGSRTPSNTPTISGTPSSSPSAGWCSSPVGLAASFVNQRIGSFASQYTEDSYFFDTMDCADEMAGFDEQKKMVLFSVSLGLSASSFYDLDSDEPYSGAAGTLVVDTCNPQTMWDTQLYVGTGCPVAGNPYLFGCVASSDDAGQDYTPGAGWQCGDRARVELPLTTNRFSPYSVYSRFTIGISPYYDVAPGTGFNISWRWVPPPLPSASETPSPSATTSDTPARSRGSSASNSPSNSASDSSSPSGSASDTPSMSYTPTASKSVTPTRTRTINSSPTTTPTVSASEGFPSSSRTRSRTYTSTRTPSLTRTATASNSIGITPTPTSSITGSNTRTRTASITATATKTAPATQTPTRTPSQTPTSSGTPPRTRTPRPTGTPTMTRRPTTSPSATKVVTPSRTRKPKLLR